MKNITSIALIAGILLLVNILSNQFFFRLDLTEDKQYTLSNATKNILSNLENPVTVTAYFSDDLPTQFAKNKRDFQDMLVEYANLSKGMVDYEFISPETDEQKQEAAQNGIQPLLINVREKDQMSQQQAFMGAILKMGEQQELIPFIEPGGGMEYALSTNIKKLAVLDKPSVGLIQGHGEPSLSELGQAYQELSILYNVENIDLNTTESIVDRFKTVALIAPKDSISPSHLAKLDDYLSRGGHVYLAYNAVDADLSQARGSALTTGVETWLQSKGIQIESSFIIDSKCGSVTVPQQRGPFTFNTQIQFPYLPLIQSFPEHPATKGMEQVILPFASPVRFQGGTNTTFTPLLESSETAGTAAAPTFFDIQKQWTNADFPMSKIPIGGVLEGNIVGETPSKMIVIGDGDFAVSGQQGGGQSKDNINLLVNGIDWLSDDTGLIELRTKGVATRPIDELEDGIRSSLKWLNFLLPIVIVIIVGVVRMQRQRSLRMKRMQESYV